jgi:putative NADPH-quinone reductase
MTTHILLFHDHPARSRVNRALADAAAALPDVTIADMGMLYPSSNDIDVDVEVARLLAADRLVLQFPVQWYSTPPLLKAWQDKVLTRMFYINAQTEGDRLKGLPVMVAATAGNVEAAYAADGVNLFPLAELLRPLQATAHRCGWSWTEPFLLYRATKIGDEELSRAGRDYAERLVDWTADTAKTREAA